jgi:ABC-type antimicrobial peptide transport system permease subunit
MSIGDVPIEYGPLPQLDFPASVPAEMTISVRASIGPPMQLARELAASLMAVNRELVIGFRPMSDQLSASLIRERLTAVLSGMFAALALLLAGLGVYGVTAYAVSCRQTEIGVRMALGSTASRVVRLVLSRTASLIAGGILIGVALSAWASALVATLVYGLEPRDPLTLFGAAATLVIVGALAAWLPAHRATRLRPAIVLRHT